MSYLFPNQQNESHFISSHIFRIIMFFVMLILSVASTFAKDTPSTATLIEKAYYNADYSKALEYANEAVALSPEEPYVYFIRGVVYGRLKQYPSSIKDLSKAIALDPENHEYYGMRADIYTAAGNKDEQKQKELIAAEKKRKNTQEAKEGARKKFSKMSKDKLYRAGYKHMIQSEYDVAAEAFMLYIEKYEPPLKMDVYYYSALCDKQIGKKERALETYTKIIQADPDSSPRAYKSRSLLYEEMGEKEKAEADKKKHWSILVENEKRIKEMIENKRNSRGNKEQEESSGQDVNR